jgi:hypothetical protein
MGHWQLAAHGGVRHMSIFRRATSAPTLGAYEVLQAADVGVRLPG